MSRRRRNRNRIVFTIIVAIVIITLDFTWQFANAYAAQCHLDQVTRREALIGICQHDWRLAHPHLSSFFWSSAFVDEYYHITSHQTPDDYALYNDFYGRYYNTREGQRVTIDQPTVYEHTVWLFGNSSTFDADVPDQYTFASQLQTLFNKTGYHLRVMNMGVSAAPVSSELAYLQHTFIVSGDSVIFEDGVIDLADTPDRLSRYWREIQMARKIAEAHGAAFYHFVQPCLYLLPITPSIRVADDMFADDYHLDERGDTIVARVLYDALTLI